MRSAEAGITVKPHLVFVHCSTVLLTLGCKLEELSGKVTN
jgi:hypothetical protein